MVFSFPQKPTIAVRIPNDDTTFNPKEYPNVVFSAKGKMSGKVLIVHGGTETDESGQGLISTRIWVVKENEKERVVITPTFDSQTHTFSLEAPNDFSFNTIYHETMIQYPSSTTSVSSLSISAPNTSLRGHDLHHLFFGSITTALSNGSVSLEPIQTDIAKIHTSNASISGFYEAGHIDFFSTNGSITAKLNIRDALDGNQSRVSTKTSNGSMDIHVTAAETSRGLWMENLNTNGRLTVGALVGKADRPSFINAVTQNGKIDVNIDASRSGQELEVLNRTSNSAIITSIMVPNSGNRFKGHAETSNASVNVNLTEDFQGKFELATSNASTIVEGSELTFREDKKNMKRGYRLKDGPSEFNIRSSNASAVLRFYPAGDSLADSK